MMRRSSACGLRGVLQDRASACQWAGQGLIREWWGQPTELAPPQPELAPLQPELAPPQPGWRVRREIVGGSVL